MNKLSKKIINIIIIILALTVTNFGQVDLTKLIKDTQKMIQTSNHITLFWWAPNIFWETSFKMNPAISEEMVKQFLPIFEKYTMFTIIDADISPLGSINHSPEVKIRKNFYVEIDGKKLFPLQKDEISSDLNNFISIMKPLMAQMLGQLGQGMQFFLFKNLSNDGTEILNPKKEKKFKTVLFDKTINWVLPLGSVLPPKFDPDTNEEFPGNYNYNPYSGIKLISK